ncbi:hypothetical protein S245_009427, partial [Arachis hypogaea]
MAINKEYYTNSNGRDFLKKVRDHREDWPFQVTQPMAGNYYPINLGIYVQKKSSFYALLLFCFLCSARSIRCFLYAMHECPANVATRASILLLCSFTSSFLITKDGKAKSNLPTTLPLCPAFPVCGSFLLTITALLHPLLLSVCYISLEDVSTLNPEKVKNSGYAASDGGRGIERVDISIDGGKIWIEASRCQKSGVQYIADGSNSDKWAW